MPAFVIRSLTRTRSSRGDTTIAAVVSYDTPWMIGEVTHYFDHTPTVGEGFGTVHHSATGKGYLGALRDPHRFGAEFDDQWVSDYLTHATQFVPEPTPAN